MPLWQRSVLTTIRRFESRSYEPTIEEEYEDQTAQLDGF